MERSKQIQIGLLALLGVLLITNIVGGGFKNWFGKSEGEQLKESAASVSTLDGSSPNNAIDATGSANSGNIPGTNATAPAVPSGPPTTIKYEQDRFDFGVIDEGEVVKHVFKFVNTGNEPLLITNAKGSCGCTVPTWPKEPVPPGATGEIKVEFNSKGKPGRQSKRVTVTANTNPTDTFIEITGEVRGKEQPAAKSGE